MMGSDCAHHQASLSALIDKQLDLPSQGALEEHLCNCPECSAKFAEQKSLADHLSGYFSQVQEQALDLWAGLSNKLPNTCELIGCELSAFLDGELTSAAQEGVRVHLKDCKDCLKHFRSLNTTNRLIVKALEFPLHTKVDLWPVVRAQLNENCNLIESELSVFIDQEMPMQRHRDITVHILQCPTCSDTVRRFSSVGQLMAVRYLPALKESLSIVEGVTSQLKVVPFKQKEKPKVRISPSVVVVAVVSIGLLACALFGLSAIVHAPAPLISGEDLLIETSFSVPSDSAEAVVYGQ